MMSKATSSPCILTNMWMMSKATGSPYILTNMWMMSKAAGSPCILTNKNERKKNIIEWQKDKYNRMKERKI
jgi:hypothetical protein